MLDSWVFIRLLDIFAISGRVVITSLMEDEDRGYLLLVEDRSLDGGTTTYYWADEQMAEFNAKVAELMTPVVKVNSVGPKLAKRLAAHGLNTYAGVDKDDHEIGFGCAAGWCNHF